jgi:hypothetical protein
MTTKYTEAMGFAFICWAIMPGLMTPDPKRVGVGQEFLFCPIERRVE